MRDRSSMVKFRKGSKVEVLNMKELPMVSWRPAEIITGNGHMYTVRYEEYSPLTRSSCCRKDERVARKSLRPPPPTIKFGQLTNQLSANDIVEVWDDQNSAWKLAIIVSRAGDEFLVGLLGSSADDHMIVKASNLRVHLSRHGEVDDSWILIRRDRKMDNLPVPQNVIKRVLPPVDLTLTDQGPPGRRGKSGPSLKKRPRAPPSDDDAESCNGATRRRRIRGRNGGIKSQQRSTKVTSYNDHAAAASMTCSSVGSCSSADDDDDDDDSDDDYYIESSAGSSIRQVVLPDDDYQQLPDEEHEEEEGGEEVESPDPHCRELFEYRYIITRFHTQGDLTWDKLFFLSDLRLRLHISQEEHRQIISHLNHS